MKQTKKSAQSRDEQREEIDSLVKLAVLFHEHGLSLPTRTIYLGAEEDIDQELAARFIKNVHTLEAVSDAPITVLANTLGGADYDGFAVYDAIRLCRCDVKVVVYGAAMSMGSVILQAADERVMCENARQMLHYGSMSGDGHAKTWGKWAKELDAVNARMEQIYLRRIREKRPLFTLSALAEMLDHDTYLSAEESVAIGLADSVL